MQPRIYIYKITFDEVPYWYWGVHKERKFGEQYFGSPSTNKWVWEFYTPKVQILEVFENNQKGWNEAISVEKRLILPDLNNPFCLNEGCGCNTSLKASAKGGSISGQQNVRLKRGALGRSKEQMTLDGIKGGTTQGRRNAKNKTGFCNPEVQRKNGKLALLNKTGIHSEEFKSSGILELNARRLGVLPWWVNKKGETKRSVNSPGEGWVRGRKWKPPSL
jgi:hypothetical protein